MQLGESLWQLFPQEPKNVKELLPRKAGFLWENPGG